MIHKLSRSLARFLAIVIVVFSLQPSALALSGSAFQPGRIIDDAIFNDSGDMTVAQIQTFLNQQVPTCDNGGNLPYYGTYDGVTYDGNILRKNLDPNYPPPYTCLFQYYENPTTHVNNIGQPGTIPSGAISAAQIIYNVSQTFGVNPQVLLVLLEKEQGLVTDDWPWPIEYQSATGYGCPDSSACDSTYYGFYNQVYNAARQFQLYNNNPNNYNYTIGLNSIPYNPNSSCGTESVNIIDQSTADLYNYTPYAPDAAALNNLYGLGDSCSSYGNRDFWRDYTNWFGSTLSQAYFEGYTWQSEVLDGSATTGVSGTAAATGQTPTSVVLNGVLHVFYYDQGDGTLRHAWSDSNGWHFETLDGAGGSSGQTNDDTGYQPKVIVYNNELYVFYHDKTTGDLREAWSDTTGQNWQFATLDGPGGKPGSTTDNVGYRTSAVVYGSGIQLFYYDLTDSVLRHAWSPDGSSWNFENLDGNTGSIGHLDGDMGQTSTAIAYGSTLQVFYYDATHGNLRHAWSDSSGWHFENLDGDPGSIGHDNSNLGLYPTVTATSTSLQVFYYDEGNGLLRHAWSDSSGWHFENLDGDPGSIGHYSANLGITPTAISDNTQGTLAVFYYDASGGHLRVAIADSSGWHFANVEGDSASLTGYSANVGLDPTAQFYDGTIQVFYYDPSAQMLRHAWGTP